MKWVILILLCVPVVHGIACVSHKDCPLDSCAGYIRQCNENICVQPDCTIPSPDNIVNREGVETFKESVKSFESGINLSARTRNTGMNNNILGSLGMNSVLMLLLKGVGIFFVALVCALLLVLAKSKGFLKYIILAAILGIAIFAISAIIKGGFIGQNWSGMRVDSFGKGRTTDISDSQLDYVSSFLVDGTEQHMDFHGQESSILVLEMQDINTLRTARLNLLGDPVIISDESAIKSVSNDYERIIFDEDRFIFIVTSPIELGNELSKTIISKYPKQPTESRLFMDDHDPPAVTDIDPLPGELTNFNRLYFTISDNQSGVDIERLKLRNMLAKPICTQSGIQYECMVANGLQYGDNNILIKAYDFSGNSVETEVNVKFDNASVIFIKSEPEHNGYTNTRPKLWFSDKYGVENILIDKGSCNRVQDQTVCELGETTEGEHEVLIETVDMAGNSEILLYNYHYDVTSPIISVHGSSITIEDNSPIKSVLADGVEILDKCQSDGSRLQCDIEPNTRVTAVDSVGNSAKI